MIEDLIRKRKEGEMLTHDEADVTLTDANILPSTLSNVVYIDTHTR